MTEYQQFLQHLKQSEYIHVLLVPLPVYGLAMGVLALAVALLLRNKQAMLTALIIVVVAGASAWLAQYYGHRAYDRVFSISNEDAQLWLNVHAQRGTWFVYVFYAASLLALATIAAQWKFPRAVMPLAIATLIVAAASVAVGGWISHAGGQVRHSEFRSGPPPNPVAPHDHGGT